MDKLLYFLVLLILLYLICDKSNVSAESFENVTLGNADDQNAINKLAQIANELMKGGATVPGNMNISDNLNINKNLNIEGNIDVKRGS
jgi:hypothetical protein